MYITSLVQLYAWSAKYIPSCSYRQDRDKEWLAFLEDYFLFVLVFVEWRVVVIKDHRWHNNFLVAFQTLLAFVPGVLAAVCRQVVVAEG